MKIKSLLLIITFLAYFSSNAQNLYTSSNAASIENEANSTTGWTGNASISSDNSTAQNGIYSLRVAVLNTGREARYNFTAVTGTVYNISIWARRTANSNNPAFANWIGLQGFTTTVISSNTWTQYNFTVTATVTTPAIRVYAGPIGAANGVEVFVDAISIMVQTPADTQPPTAPSNLAVSNITSTSALVTWAASSDNIAVTSYIIRQNGTSIGNISGSTFSYQINNLTPSTTYSITIQATDAANNISPESIPLTLTTLPPPPDTNPPSIPTNLLASGLTDTTVNLSWVASTDNVGIAGYRIYMNNVLADTSLNTQVSITGLTPGSSYTFFVAAFDTSGNLSDTSSHITITTPVTNQLVNYTSSNANLSSVDWQAANFYASENVGIGTFPTSPYRLAVNGNIRAKEITVETGWSDFVFEPDYKLATLEEVEAFILKNGHLKDIPSNAEVMEHGIALAKMNKLLLMKIEEITLYLIQSNKRIIELEEQIKSLNLTIK